MGIYANIGNSDIQAGRNAKLPYLGEGDYEVILETIRKGERNVDGRDFFAIEFTIHKSNNANFETGTKATVLFVANKFPKYFLQDVKGFVVAATNSSDGDVTEEVIDYVSGEDQPLAGTQLSVYAWDKVSESTGKPFTNFSFSPVSN